MCAETERLHPDIVLRRRVLRRDLHVRHRVLAAALSDERGQNFLGDKRTHPLLLHAHSRWDSRQPEHRHLRHRKPPS